MRELRIRAGVESEIVQEETQEDLRLAHGKVFANAPEEGEATKKEEM